MARLKENLSLNKGNIRELKNQLSGLLVNY